MAAMSMRSLGAATAVLIITLSLAAAQAPPANPPVRVRATIESLGLGEVEGIEIHNARLSGANEKYVDFLYTRQQRQGLLRRDCQRMVNQDRNVFAACMVAVGDADAMVTGLTRSAAVCLDDVRHVIGAADGAIPFGLTLVPGIRGKTIFIADSLVNFRPTADQIVAIVVGAAAAARRLGHEPRVALLSHSTFGDPPHDRISPLKEAITLLDERKVDFEYDGEMSPDVALEPAIRALYPFCRLTGDANVLVVPGLHSAHIAARLLHHLGGGASIGPLLTGLAFPVQIVPMDASVNQIVDMACLAADQAVIR